MLTRRNAKAYAILALLIDRYYDDGYMGQLVIEPYLNGRENGFAVTHKAANWSKKAVFSEDRRSDSIVVYTGESYKFSMQGNSLSAEIYANAQYFGPDDFQQVIEFIQEFITTLDTSEAV